MVALVCGNLYNEVDTLFHAITDIPQCAIISRHDVQRCRKIGMYDILRAPRNALPIGSPHFFRHVQDHFMTVPQYTRKPMLMMITAT